MGRYIIDYGIGAYSDALKKAIEADDREEVEHLTSRCMRIAPDKEECARRILEILRFGETADVIGGLNDLLPQYFPSTHKDALALIDACTAHYEGLAPIKKLLDGGVSPNSTYWDGADIDNIYEEIVTCWTESDQNDAAARNSVAITDLLIDYGLDIEHPVRPYDEGNVIHPFWILGLGSPVALPLFAYFLEKGVSAASVDEAISHAVGDLIYVDSDVFYREESGAAFFFVTVKMMMLAASYPDTIAELEWLRDFMEFDRNHYDTARFRDPDRFAITVNFDKCATDGRGIRLMEPERSQVTIVEKDTGRAVWSFLFSFQKDDT